MGQKGEPLPVDQRIAYELGLCHREVNTILGRIRYRDSGEPTARERERLAELKAKMVQLKSGEWA